MRIAVDAFGGDNAPEAVVEGAILASNSLGGDKNNDLEILLVGDEEKLKKLLHNRAYGSIKIVDAKEVITNFDAPTVAIRKKKNSSMIVALNLVKDKKADAFVSAGNTGAILAGALTILGRIRGVNRPALAPILPTDRGACVLIDGGANVNCKPINLLQFALMGSVYAKEMLGRKEPLVGLVNNGSEEGKGSDLTKEAYGLLKNGDLRFAGNVEAREIPYGVVDVIVCDGFVGNVILKLTEGVAGALMGNVKKLFLSGLLSKAAALLLSKNLSALKKKMDYTEQGGAPFLGVNGTVIKAHGNSNAKVMYHTIIQATRLVHIEDLIRKQF